MLLQLVCTIITLLSLTRASGELVITEADRQLTATTQRLISSTLLTVENRGKSDVFFFTICEEAGLKSRAAMFEVGVTNGEDVEVLALAATQPDRVPSGISCTSYTYTLAKEMTATVVVKAVYTEVLQPYPTEKAVSEPQRLALHASLHVLSPYKILNQSTTLELGNGKVESYAKHQPSSKKGSKIVYGPYTDILPFSSAESINVHYENNHPFAVATQAEREIQISHWGNVYVEEQYSLVNAGAKVKGEWSRLELMTNPDYGRAAIRELQAVLLPGSSSIYFRDAIGNISTSAVRASKSLVIVGLMPRYPLFGGWSAKFLFGWSMPLEVVVAQAPTGSYMATSFFAPAIKDVEAREVVVRVVLPEGATYEGVDCKLDLEVSLGKKYTYFDVFGRTVVELRKRNVVPEMNVPFTVTYSYPLRAMVTKPLLMMAVFAGFFGAVMTYVRSSFSINGKGGIGAGVGKQHTS